MNVLIGTSAFLASALSAIMMLYISLATPLGPWVGPMWALALAALGYVITSRPADESFQHNALQIIAAAGIGGISAVATAFSYPTYMFLAPEEFYTWLARPFSFTVSLAALIISGGALAFIIAHTLHATLISKPLPFPVSHVVATTLRSVHSAKNGITFLGGIVCSIAFQLLHFFEFMRSSLTIPCGSLAARFASLDIPLDMGLLLVTLGIVTGTILALPLAIGLCIKLIVIPLLYGTLHIESTQTEFVMGWCGGMILASIILYLLKKIINVTFNKRFASIDLAIDWTALLEASLLAAIPIIFFYWRGLSLLKIGYLLLATTVAVTFLTLIAVRIGLAPLGRFATFVLMPGLLWFRYSAIEITLVSAFVELTGGILVDMMFNRKTASMLGVPTKRIIIAQIIGLAAAAVTIALVFWLLADKGLIGAPPLIAQRSQARALLVTMHSYEIIPLILGAASSILLLPFRANHVLIITALLMPTELVLPLLFGSLVSFTILSSPTTKPFWIGIYASSSLFLALKTLIDL